MSPPPTREAALADFPSAYAKTARFTIGSPRNLTVTAGGKRVLFCRSRSASDPTLCLWAIDLATDSDTEPGAGTERLVVDPRELGDNEANEPAAERARRERARESGSGIVAFSVDGSGSTASFALAGSLYIVDLVEGHVHSPAIDGSAFDPRLNHDGTALAYIDGSSLKVFDVATITSNEGDGASPEANRSGGGLILELTDPDPLISYGRAEFIAAEEMGRGRGYWWAPDGESLLVAKVDENLVDRWWITDPAHPGRAPNEVRYPAAGTTNASVELHLVGRDGLAWNVDWSEHGRFEYLADVVWQDGHPPLVVRQTRDQRLVSVAILDVEAETVTEGHTIVDEIWVELQPGAPRWCTAGLLTIEDRDGARQLFLDGASLTGSDLNVRSIVGTTGTTGSADGSGGEAVVVTAWTEPSEIHLLLVRLEGGADRPAPLRLTTSPGVHAGVIKGPTIVVSSSSPDLAGATTTVSRLTLGRAWDPEPVATTELATIESRAADPGFGAEPTFISLGHRDLASALFLPADHNGADPLPVILDPYGGPHAQRVLKVNNAHLVSRWLAEQGYAVLVTDGRGTPGRGPDWEREVFANLADPVLDDQLSALDAALDRHGFLDRSRVGIRGWSFGGYLAALAVLRHPDRFHAAIAGAPVTSWQLYDTHYTERDLGHPDTDPKHYRQSNLWNDGDPVALERPLLLIHGLADDNVVAAHTLQFSSELLANGCPHRVLPLSGVTHMTPQEAVAKNLLLLQLRFFDDTIGGSRA
ncbi:MAG: S9 family peptidase [Actinomycetia bacterium]|nr:S9 family peptidase [Actinomycetes bacterium]